MKKRIFALLLAALLLSSAVSCGSDTAEETISEEAAETAAETVPGETGISLGIPEEDNGGRDFHVLVPIVKAYEFVTEATGEAVNDAIFERSLKTEEHFNIKFSYQYEDGGWDVRDTYNGLISNAVLAGDSAYDFATGYIVCTLPLGIQNTFIDLAQMDDLNLDNPWWMNNQLEDLNINGSLFCCLGDANLSIYKDCTVVYFNKQVLDNFELENPYTLVRENKWVMEKFLEMSEAAVVDLNGDGKLNKDTDALGAYMQGVPFRAFQTALEVQFFATDENNRRFVAPLTERTLNAYDLAYQARTNDYFYLDNTAVDFYTFTEMFATDRALFHLSYLYVLESDNMRNMESDFGLVPYPKYDENQETFYTQIGTSSNVNFLPMTAADPALSCRVLETLAYHSMLDVIPAYYTVALENKYTRDTDVPEMLALIRDGMTMNLEFALSASFDPSPNCIFQWGGDSLASYMASVEKKLGAQLDAICNPED